MQFPQNDPIADDRNVLASEIEGHRLTIAAKNRDSNLKLWQSLAGDHLDGMLRDPKKAIEYLSHSEARLRIVAILALEDYFGQASELLSQWQEMARTDPEPSVRLHARLCLVNCYVGKDATAAKKLLAEIIKDPTVDDQTRLMSYSYIMTINDEPLRGAPKTTLSEVDWDVVNRILADNSGDVHGHNC